MARILVIDDDHAVLATIRLLLERHAHDVVAADNGRRGLALLQDGAFDLLIVDIFMPVMDGLETMNLVRRYRPEIPVIVMSGHEVRSEKTPNFLQMATKLGAISSVQKPFRLAEFLRIVDRCLSDLNRSPPPSAMVGKNLPTD